MVRGTKLAQQVVIGITGTAGAGKGAVVDYLVDRYAFMHLSVRGFLLEEIRRRDLPNVNRNTMGEIANELRRKHSPAYIVQTLFAQATKTSASRVIIESVRVPAEVDALRNLACSNNFFLLSVDADPKIRYSRIVARKSETDNVSYEEFLEQERIEMNNNEKFKQNLRVCAQKSDFSITNNGNLADLQQSINLFLTETVGQYGSLPKL